MNIYKTSDGVLLETIVTEGKGITGLEEVIPNTIDAAREKHIPVVEETDDGLIITVGSVAHPMEPEHYIMWIEVSNETEVQRKYLNPGEEPKANFNINGSIFKVLVYCNLHGLWSN